MQAPAFTGASSDHCRGTLIAASTEDSTSGSGRVQSNRRASQLIDQHRPLLLSRCGDLLLAQSKRRRTVVQLGIAFAVLLEYPAKVLLTGKAIDREKRSGSRDAPEQLGPEEALRSRKQIRPRPVAGVDAHKLTLTTNLDLVLPHPDEHAVRISLPEPYVHGAPAEVLRGIRSSPISRGNHALSEIVMATLDSGLRLELLTEHDSVPWDALPGRMAENA